VWDANTGKVLFSLGAKGQFVPERRVQPRWQAPAVGAATMAIARLLGTSTRKRRCSRPCRWSRPGRRLVLAVACSPDGKWLAATGNRKITIWDAGTRRRASEPAGHRGLIESLAFSADSKRLISGGRDKRVQVWDLEKGEPEWAGRPQWIDSGLAFSEAASSRSGSPRPAAMDTRADLGRPDRQATSRPGRRPPSGLFRPGREATGGGRYRRQAWWSGRSDWKAASTS